MTHKTFITTILPLKLEWEPWYYSPGEVSVGARVRVRLAGRTYIAVVSGVGGTPDIPEDRIQEILSVETALEPITPEEIRLWRFIADYYLCTVGEVYKAAYPAMKQTAEGKKPRRKAAPESGNLITQTIRFEDDRPLLLLGTGREAIYRGMIRKTLAEGKDVLMLSPGAPTLSYPQIRDLAGAVRRRNSEPRLVYGRRPLLFLPFAKLGLVIVDEEQDVTYKQESPAPRYNGRDVAVYLASLHKASVILGSACPSLESLLNVRSGKYCLLRCADVPAPMEVIDTTAERRKRGMEGELSRKLLAAKEEIEAAGGKMLVLESWELGNTSKLKLDKYDALAVLHFEVLLARPGFRSDEKAMQLIAKLRSTCRRLILQTADASHPVFSGNADALLEERQAFRLPPFTREIHLRVEDTNEARLAKMTRELERRFGALRLYLPKDRGLAAAKKEIARKIRAFEEEFRYTGHIIPDVDPL